MKMGLRELDETDPRAGFCGTNNKPSCSVASDSVFITTALHTRVYVKCADMFIWS
jgi:hypothetical protein